MDPRYLEWMHRRGTGRGQCAQVTAAMVKVFPELVRVRGYYHCFFAGKRAHWWLVALDGEIVDPTYLQFPSKGVGSYEPWVEGAEEPAGKCLNCGAEFFKPRTSTCSEECASELAATLTPVMPDPIDITDPFL